MAVTGAVAQPTAASDPVARYVVQQTRRKPARQRVIGAALRHTVLVGLSIIFIFPLAWMIITSLKTQPQAITVPPIWWPHPFVWDNYPQALQSQPFLRYFWNTFFYCATTVAGVLISSSLVAYGFSCITWRGRDKIFFVMVATLLLPFIVTLIPLFVLFKNLGWVGTYKPLIIPTFFASSVFSTFLLRQFFMTIPQSLSDAARVDGAREFRIYSRIILPLSKPALATVALFQFIYAWNDFLGPLIYINTSGLYPVSIGLYQFLSQFGTDWPWMMAASTCATIPIILLFFLTQKTFIQGITLTGEKG